MSPLLWKKFDKHKFTLKDKSKLYQYIKKRLKGGRKIERWRTYQ